MLPAHAVIEIYSTLTRLPGGLAVAAQDAARELARRFPDAPLRLGDDRATLVQTLARAGVHGGAAYDGLVGLEAAAHRQTLLTLDRRASATYLALGVAFELIGD